MEQNAYQTPEAELVDTSPGTTQNRLPQAIKGEYNFGITNIIGQAWQRTNGSKGIIIGTLVVYYLIIVIPSFAMGFVGGMFGMNQRIAFNLLVQIPFTIIGFVLTAGMVMIIIRRAANLPASISTIFAYFPKTLKITGLLILMYLMIGIGFLLLILPGIYLSMAYMFALPLMIEKNLGIWEAMEASRKSITHHWFKVFGLFFCISALGLLGVVTVIGWIWLLPLAMLSIGTLYVHIYGVQAK